MRLLTFHHITFRSQEGQRTGRRLGTARPPSDDPFAGVKSVWGVIVCPGIKPRSVVAGLGKSTVSTYGSAPWLPETIGKLRLLAQVEVCNIGNIGTRTEAEIADIHGTLT